MIKLQNIKLEAIASSLPLNEICNEQSLHPLFGDETIKVINATGIKKRRINNPNKTSSSLELSVLSAKRIFEETSIKKDEIGAVIFVTTSPAYIMPNNATLAHNDLQLKNDVLCYDINIACSGYPYGLLNAGLLAQALNKKVLLLDGDKQSTYISELDKSTAAIFSDAGSASIISISNNQPQTNKSFFSFLTESQAYDALIIKGGGSKYPFTQDSLQYKQYENNSQRKDIHLQMHGLDVFKLTTSLAPKAILKLINDSKIDTSKEIILILHQANHYILKIITTQLRAHGLNIKNVPSTLAKYGNTTSVSLPLTLCDYFDKQNIKQANLILCGYGAGFSISTAYLELNNCQCLGVSEYDI